MLRLARKAGFVPCKSLGLAVELEFDLRRDFPYGAGAVAVSSPPIQAARRVRLCAAISKTPQ
jgi:hypothetical protein